MRNCYNLLTLVLQSTDAKRREAFLESTWHNSVSCYNLLTLFQLPEKKPKTIENTGITRDSKLFLCYNLLTPLNHWKNLKTMD